MLKMILQSPEVGQNLNTLTPKPPLTPLKNHFLFFILCYVISYCLLELAGLDQEPKYQHKNPPNNTLLKV